MDHRDILGGIVSPEAFLADHEICSTRRGLLVAPLLAALSLCRTRRRLPAQSIRRRRRLPFPARSSGTTGWPVCRRTAARWQHFTAALDKPGPYLVLMKWYPGYMSAPHTYATDRLSLVLSGTWWVNSGADFDPNNTVPVPREDSSGASPGPRTMTGSRRTQMNRPSLVSSESRWMRT